MTSADWFWCNSCSAHTKHELHATHNKCVEAVDGDEVLEVWHTTHELRVCRGCETAALRVVQTSSEYMGRKVEFYPPHEVWEKPNWLHQLSEPSLKGIRELLDEVYGAVTLGNRRLALMGCRAVSERLMTKRVGDLGTFKLQLAAMLDQGHISQKDHDALDAAINAGSAAAHRGYCPKPDILDMVLGITERLVQSEFVDGHRDAIASTTPPRKS